MDRTAILNDYVTDMAAVEKHIFEAVDRQVKDDDTKRYPEALGALTEVRDTLSRHVAALEAYNASTEGGGFKETLKEAVTGALGVAALLSGKIHLRGRIGIILSGGNLDGATMKIILDS